MCVRARRRRASRRNQARGSRSRSSPPTSSAAMDGDLGAVVRAAIEKAGLHPFEKIWDNGYRQITSSTHPIAAPGDLKGFKIRVPVSPLWTAMFKAFGASPASINFNEVYW